MLRVLLCLLFTSIFSFSYGQTFYGMANQGGSYNKGTLIKCTPPGKIIVLVNFDSIHGANPNGNVIQGTDGYLYGMTSAGGAYGLGTLFKCSLSGSLTTLVNFNGSNGTMPYGSLLLAIDGNMYGMTSSGGANGFGTLFKCTANGALTTLISFTKVNGAYPSGNLIQANDSNFYGMTSQGGDSNVGTLFKYNANTNTLTTLFSFATAKYGSYPQSSLIQAFNDSLYGVTLKGGRIYGGVLFSSSLSGVHHTLYNFDGTGTGDAGDIYGKLLQASDTVLYGLSSSGPDFKFGTVFSYVLSSNTEGINAMNGCTYDLARPTGSFIQASDGYLYSMVNYGEPYCYGAIIKANLSRSSTVIASFNDTNGADPNGDLLQADSFSAIGNIIVNPCNGNSNGIATVDASGGYPAYTYSWSTLPTQTTQAATGLSVGTYTVTITDSVGKHLVVFVNVTQLSDSMNSIWSHCNNSQGVAWASAYGGATPYTYLWSNGFTIDTIRGLSGGTYSVTITDSQGCIIRDNVRVSDTNNQVHVTQTNVTCYGANNGSASISFLPYYTYLWSPGGYTNSSVTGLSAGTYSITITNADTVTCISTARVIITQPAPLTATITPTSNIRCHGLLGCATINDSGGTSPYTYLWTPSGATSQSNCSLSAGTYTVIATDKNGCTETTSITITQPPPLKVTVTNTPIACSEGVGSATAIDSGGTSPYRYSWVPSGGTNATATGLAAGCYTVEVVDKNGCSASAQTCITQPILLKSTICGDTEIHCNGESTGTLISCSTGGTSPYSYSWAPAGGDSNIAAGLSAGCYTLTVTDSNGCTATSRACLTQPTAIIVMSGATPDDGNSTGSAWVHATGGLLPYTYSWADGNTTDSISHKASGKYCCMTTDSAGCGDSICVIINSDAGVSAISNQTGEIEVYPNPSSGIFTLSYHLNLTGTGEESNSALEIYNVLGQNIYQSKINSDITEINISTQPQGIYLYRVVSETGALIGEGKVVIQK